ncbi:MAG TPA: hypothetical protein VJ810_11560 [Blastocatellia bacterium]|nr:hypothetical protein [Blastocatellia bacterium]
MRITIDIDGKDMEGAPRVVAAASTPPNAMDAGASATSLAADQSAEDAGGPPAWLLEAVGRAASMDAITRAEESASENAGSGPA